MRAPFALPVLAATAFQLAAFAGKPVRPDTVASPAPVAELPSIADTLRRADSLSRIADSVRRADSASRFADSLRRADSTRLASRTWLFLLPADPAGRLGPRLEIAWRRSGRARVAPIMTDSVLSCPQAAARAGAGHVLRLETGSVPRGLGFSARAMDGATCTASDSLDGVVAAGTESISRLARILARRFVPTSRDSMCRADSLSARTRPWRLRLGNPEDSAATRELGPRIRAGLAASPWASVAPDTGECPACRVLDASLSRRDSLFVLDASIPGATDPDTIRIVSRDIPDLVPRLLSRIAAAPTSCPSDAPPDPKRDLWTFAADSDSSNARFVPELEGELAAAFAARPDRQFLPLHPDTSLLAAARAARASRFARVHLSGSDAMWTLRVLVLGPSGSPVDSSILRRGGPRRRVFAWFGRHVAAFGNDRSARDSCLAQLREQAGSWALVADSAAGIGGLDSSLRRAAGGRLASLPSPIPCRDRACIDSVAEGLGIARLLEAKASRDPAGNWIANLVATDVRSDEETSLRVAGDTSAEATSERIWSTVSPLPSCRDCIDSDTLEAALALVVAPWTGGSDSAAHALRDTLSRILSKEGDYQILSPSASAAWSGNVADSAGRAALRCRTGAVRIATVHLDTLARGWRVRADLCEAGTGGIVRSLDILDPFGSPGRPVQISPWVARRLLGTETRAAPPPPRIVPWKKILLLGIPALLGIGSTAAHW